MTAEAPNRIGGNRLALGGDTFERRNPAKIDEVVSVATESTGAETQSAVDAALGAGAEWGRTTAVVRADLLEKAAAALASRADDVARRLTEEEGKPIGDARNEVGRAVRNLRLFAGEALRLRGATYPSDEPGAIVRSEHSPIGVVAVITPWNFPASLSTRKLGPALAAGNTVVWKPSPMTPSVSDLIADAFDEAGFPAGVFNVVQGVAAGAHLVADRRVAGVTFTGSTRTGRAIHDALGLGRREQLEMGGNNPVVVLADADLDRAADVVARSSFSVSGQACTGAGRILVEAGVHDELIERVAAIAARGYTLGDGFTEGVNTGPLIDGDSVASMEAVVADAEAAGAKALVGGRRPMEGGLENGWFFPPTLLVDVDPGSRVAAEEVFGPVVGVERVASLEEAIARGNDTEYGLTAAICTTSLSSANRFAAEIQAGLVKVNRPTIGASFAAPFGGVKASGSGVFKEQLGPGVMDFYTQVNTVEVAP